MARCTSLANTLLDDDWHDPRARTCIKSGFGLYVKSRAQVAQSHQRRFRRWLSNRRIDVVAAHHAMIGQALCAWSKERLDLSLDTTVVWNCFCIVWVGVVYRGRTVPVAWRVVAHSSSTVRLWTIQRVLRQAQTILPGGVAIVLLADRGESRWQPDEIPPGDSGKRIFGFGLNVRFRFSTRDNGAKCHPSSCSPDKLISPPWCRWVKLNPTPTFTWRLPMISKVMRIGRL